MKAKIINEGLRDKLVGPTKEVINNNLSTLDEYELEHELIFAIRKNDINTIRILLDYGVNPTCFDEYDNTALFLAIMNRKTNIVELLIKYTINKEDLNIPYINNIETPLMYAVHYGLVHIVELLLNAGCNVNFTNRRGLTALDYAKSVDYEGNYDEPHKKIIDLLIKHGAK